jgi:putative ABC transport system permease protein
MFVKWSGTVFSPNFFLVLPPGLLDQAAGTYMTSVYLDAGQRRSLVDLVRRFPSISVFDIDAMLKQVRHVMDKANLAVQYVFLFTLLAGITVLLAAIQATRDERRYESAILRTLGATRRTVLQGVAAEFVALGLLSGFLGAGAASLLLATRHWSVSIDVWVWSLGWGSAC